MKVSSFLPSLFPSRDQYPQESCSSASKPLASTSPGFRARHFLYRVVVLSIRIQVVGPCVVQNQDFDHRSNRTALALGRHAEQLLDVGRGADRKGFVLQA